MLPWLSVRVGILTGGRLLAGGSLYAGSAERLANALGGAAGRVGVLGYIAYGLAYALNSLGCNLPLFLAVVSTAFARGGLTEGVSQLVLYALGMGAVVSALTILVALLGRGVLARVRGAGRVLQPFASLLLLVTGGYIVYYWLSVGTIVR